jgi:uncharacterized protein (UPF0548 family)
MSAFTYPRVGASADPDRLPPGYDVLRVAVPIGAGGAVFAAAGAAVLEWRMHRAIGVRMTATAPRAEPGVRVVVGMGVGPLRIEAPCEVVWAADGPRRAGFAYGTLPGHPQRGEESFVVEWGPDDAVTLRVTAFSRAAAWYARAGGPLTRALQRAYAHRCGRALRALAARQARRAD